MAADAGNKQEMMTIVREFNAPRELVWKVWTEPEYVMQWWGPKGFTAPVCRMDFRVGGKYLMCMKSPEGAEFWNGGEYYEIVPLEKIVYSMHFADADGNKVDAAAYGMEHTAIEDVRDSASFEELGEGRTRLTLVGNETMEEAKASGQVEGWGQILDKVEAVLGR